MPLNALQIVDQFKMKSSADRMAEQANQVATQMKMDETFRTLNNRNVLGELMKSNPTDLNAVATDYMGQTGDVDGMFKLQDRASQQEELKRRNSMAALDSHLKGLDWLSKTGTTVTKENYGKWRDQAVSLGIAAAGELPEQYDEKVMDRLTGAANAELKEIKINLPGRRQQQVFTRNGKEVYRSQPYERDAPKTAPETWGPEYEEGGRKFIKSTRGNIKEVGGRGTQSGDMAMLDRLIASGAAKDDAEAFELLRQFKRDPRVGAMSMTKMLVDEQKQSFIQPGDEGYRSPQEIYDEVLARLSAMPETPPPETDYSPAPPSSTKGAPGKPAPSKPAPKRTPLQERRMQERSMEIRARYQSGEIDRAEARRMLEELNRG